MPGMLPKHLLCAVECTVRPRQAASPLQWDKAQTCMHCGMPYVIEWYFLSLQSAYMTK